MTASSKKEQEARSNVIAVLERGESYSLSLEHVTSLLKNHDHLVERLYRKRLHRETNPKDIRELEDLVAQSTFELISRSARPPVPGWYQTFRQEYRAIWKAEMPLFIYTATLFLLSMLCGWNVAANFPSLAPVLLPQGAMENIIENTPWFEQLNRDPLLGGIAIAINNIKVATFCFLSGTILGLGGVFMLCFNGVFFGAIMGFCFRNGFHDRLTDFVVAHGALELSIIVASAFASLLYGRAFFQRPLREFPKRLRAGGRSACIIAMGIIPWLVLAAIIEAFVSPLPMVPFSIKASIGLILAAAFWYWNLKSPLVGTRLARMSSS